jgi:ABC-2 type transport system ATP-binding protein
MLATDRLTKCYGSFCALHELTLHIPPGEVFGLLGPNGSGKSTALRLLLGFMRPTSGRAWIAGHDCWADSVAVRRHVAYLPGELRLYENMTGRQFLRFLEGVRGQALQAEADRMAQRFDISLDRPIRHLSSGMKRKLALMQVLLPQVPLLILDEPTNTLDPTMRDDLLDQLAEAKQRGQTVLFSSHVLQEVERVCDRVGILRQGKLVHLEAMQPLRDAREVHVHFTQEPDSPPRLAGVELLRNNGPAWTLVAREGVQPLLGWLAGQPVADVRIEPLGLAAIYSRYHGER